MDTRAVISKKGGHKGGGHKGGTFQKGRNEAHNINTTAVLYEGVNTRAVLSQKGGHKGGTFPKGWTQRRYFPKRVDKGGGGHEGAGHKGGTFLKGRTVTQGR